MGPDWRPLIEPFLEVEKEVASGGDTLGVAVCEDENP